MGKQKKTTLLVLLLVCLFAMLPVHVFAAKASIKLESSKLSMTVGSSKTINAIVTGKSDEVKWSSSKKSVATVNSNGTVTAKKAGKATIKAKANGKTATCVVTVKKVNYKALYRKFLERTQVEADTKRFSPGSFYLVNIDRKDVPELVITDKKNIGPHYDYYVYTIKKGKVKYLGTVSEKGVGSVPYLRYSKKYKGIYSGGVAPSGVWESLYSISGSKLKLTKHLRCFTGNFGSSEIYKTGPKETVTTKKKYNAYWNKYFKSVKKVKMYANTAANRKKVL